MKLSRRMGPNYEKSFSSNGILCYIKWKPTIDILGKKKKHFGKWSKSKATLEGQKQNLPRTMLPPLPGTQWVHKWVDCSHHFDIASVAANSVLDTDGPKIKSRLSAHTPHSFCQKVDGKSIGPSDCYNEKQETCYWKIMLKGESENRKGKLSLKMTNVSTFECVARPLVDISIKDQS